MNQKDHNSNIPKRCQKGSFEKNTCVGLSWDTTSILLPVTAKNKLLQWSRKTFEIRGWRPKFAKFLRSLAHWSATVMTPLGKIQRYWANFSTWYLCLKSIFLSPDSNHMTHGTWRIDQLWYNTSIWRFRIFIAKKTIKMGSPKVSLPTLMTLLNMLVLYHN